MKHIDFRVLSALAFGRERLLPSLFFLLLSAAVPFFDFYLANISQAVSICRLFKMLLLLFLLLVAALLVLRLVLFRSQLWRIAVALGFLAILVFSYAEIKSLLLETIFSSELRTMAISFVGCIVLPAALFIYAISFAPKSLVVSMAIVGALLFFSSVKVAANWQNGDTIDAVEAGDVNPVITYAPDVYWIVLDSYPGSNVLKSEFGFDNSDFYSDLHDHGFHVLQNSKANHASTIYSITNTLSMDYILTDSSSREQVRNMHPLLGVMRGGSKVVSRFKMYGYKYVHFSNGYEYVTVCDDQADKCVKGNKGFDELTLAILRRTPVIDYLMVSEEEAGKMETLPIDWGGVDDLGTMLEDIFEVDSPYFVYAHIISPHPPMRFKENCTKRPFYPDLATWKSDLKDEFIEQLKCTNRQIMDVIEEIESRSADSVIILQSDHGSAFNDQFETAPDSWTARQFEERFAVLNAMRLPERCKSEIRDGTSLVNTFRIVFACLSDGGIEYKEDRYFVSMYNDSPHFGKMVEWGAEL